MIDGLPPIRDYQREAVEDTFARWARGDTRVPIVCATGLGKTRIAAELVDEWCARNPDRRALAVAHTRELIAQLARAMRDTGRTVGTVMGARNAPSARIVVASRQTLASARRRAQIRDVGLVVIDECHFSVRENTYGTILDHFGAFDAEPAVMVAGFTATLSRSDSSSLASIWGEPSFTRDIMFGIRSGYLLDVRGERIVVDQMDMRRVRARGGDFDKRSLGDELERSLAVETVAGEVKRLAGGMKGLAFWPLVATAEHACEVFAAHGIPSGVVYGAQDARERARVLRAHRAREILWVHNAMALTVGYDDPDVEAVLMGRATRSRVLYVQMAGRALRVPPRLAARASRDRPPALLIDVTGASDDCDLAQFIDLSPARARDAAIERAPDATLFELDGVAREIDEELARAREGATFLFDSDEYAGPVTSRAFDPLSRARVWCRTAGGVPFMRAADGERAWYVFIAESEGGAGVYDVIECAQTMSVDARGQFGAEWARAACARVSFSRALEFAEGVAEMTRLDDRRARWRAGPVSARAAREAARHGVDVAGMRAGEASDAIDAAVASRIIDPLVARVKNAR